MSMGISNLTWQNGHPGQNLYVQHVSWLREKSYVVHGMTSGHSAALCKKLWRGFFKHLLVEFGVGG